MDEALFNGCYDMPCANRDSCGCDGGEGPFKLASLDGEAGWGYYLVYDLQVRDFCSG